MAENKLRVADLFCGGGGISEGLKQAGMDIVFGLDNSKPATDTFSLNHRNAKVIKSPIEDVEIDDIPDFDVLVGGPPCVEFSASKQGRGNILAGLKLVQAFLRVVYIRKPQYWIMENVPKIVLHLPEKIPLKWIGIDSPDELHVPTRATFNTADYGVPQARKRFLMGNFPIPDPTHAAATELALFSKEKRLKPWVTLKNVLDTFPTPLKNMPKEITIEDINYDLALPSNLLSDHFHEVELSSDEARRIKKAKEAHPYMGRMPFPDVSTRPARTVVATQLGRETLVIGETINKKDRFRRATVRECATIQGYPISYQFMGTGLSARYRVIGNGVPPMLTYKIGQLIQQDSGRKCKRKPLITKEPKQLSPQIYKQAKRAAVNHRITRRFCELVPGKEVRGCRVEFINTNPGTHRPQLYKAPAMHIVDWHCQLTVGEGKANMKQRIFSLEEAITLIHPIFALPEETSALIEMMRSAEKELMPDLCDASTLQASWAEKISTADPEKLVDDISKIVERFFPSERYHDAFIPSSNDYDYLPKRGMRIRLAVSALIVAYCCDVINKSTIWSKKNSKLRYTDPSWLAETGKNKIINPSRVLDLIEIARRKKNDMTPDLFSSLR